MNDLSSPRQRRATSQESMLGLSRRDQTIRHAEWIGTRRSARLLTLSQEEEMRKWYRNSQYTIYNAESLEWLLSAAS